MQAKAGRSSREPRIPVAYMDWKAEYSVENALIDKQHKALFDLVNEVAEKVKSGNLPEVKSVINRLATYTVEHFKDEEAIMIKAGYANLEDHEMIHAELLEKVQELQHKLANNQAVSLVAVIRFLSDWLKEHILKDDMAYKAAIKKIS
ncbi:MAG: bacteriohemerythrin [Holophaga sp.]|nr:bacteriohemerythrin [Holophaga sp.]